MVNSNEQGCSIYFVTNLTYGIIYCTNGSGGGGLLKKIKYLFVFSFLSIHLQVQHWIGCGYQVVVTSPSIIWSVHSSLSPDKPILLSLVPHPVPPNPLPPGEEKKISKARSNASGYKIIWTYCTHSHTNLEWKCISLWDKAGQQRQSSSLVLNQCCGLCLIALQLAVERIGKKMKVDT